MTRTITAFALAAVTALGACSRQHSNPADSALSVDLSLAAQQQRSLDSLSAAERNEQTNALTNGTPAAAPLAPVHHASSRVYRSSRSGGVAGSASTRATVEKHTQRDAAIGAAAGAVIGATSSRNKVKGGIIGAAVGGILGGVIGNNVDKTKKP